MLNHKTIFKQKSKILLIILSIFGLAFSYSCSCRSGGDPTRVNGGTASGNWTMQLTSDGKGYKQEATISFEKATATLKSVTDVDSGITIEDGDFVYEGNTLKLKKDTTDPSEIDATTAAKINWDGTTVKKVKATFTLTPSASDVDLDATEKEVIISIKKIKKIVAGDINGIFQKVNKEAKEMFTDGSVGNYSHAEFKMFTGNYATGVYTMNNVTTETRKMTVFSEENVSKLNTMINWYLPTLDEISSGKKDPSSEEGTVGTANFYKVSYDITWGDDFESAITSIAFEFKL